MNYYAYNVDEEQKIKVLDEEFDVVTLVGYPEHGVSEGYDVCIYDSRSKNEIAQQIRKMDRKNWMC